MNPEGTCVIAANIMLVGDEEHKCGHWEWLQLTEAGKAGRSAKHEKMLMGRDRLHWFPVPFVPLVPSGLSRWASSESSRAPSLSPHHMAQLLGRPVPAEVLTDKTH